MNKVLYFVSTDIELKNEFEKCKNFLDIFVLDSLDDIPDGIVSILVSNEKISFNDFLEWYDKKESSQQKKHIFYRFKKIEGNIENQTNILTSKGIVPISFKKTPLEVIEIIENKISKGNITGNNIVVFFGSSSKVGTTMISHSIAETLAGNLDLNLEDRYSQNSDSVCLMLLNPDNSIEYFSDNTLAAGLESIKVKVINNILSSGEFIDACIRKGNLFVFQGCSSIRGKRHYYPEYIENLIKIASRLFKCLIIDAGCSLETGISIGALNSTYNKYLITTQQESAYITFKKMSTQLFKILGIKEEDFNIVVNKYIENDFLLTPAQIAKRYNGCLSGYIPYLPYSWQAENERVLLLHYNDTSFNNSIRKISNIISKQIGMKCKNEAFKKVSVFEKFFLLKRQVEASANV